MTAADRTGEVLRAHSITVEALQGLSRPAGEGSAEQAIAEAFSNELATVIEALCDIPTVPGTNAFRAKASAVDRYFRATLGDAWGQLLPGLDLNVRAAASVLQDAIRRPA